MPGRWLTGMLLLSVIGAPDLIAGERITDQNGRTVIIPDHVARVATLTIPGASMAMAVDLGAKRLAAIHPASRSEIAEGILGKMFPAARQIRSDAAGESFMPNIEALLAARPDVVLQWGDRGSEIVAPIEKAGLPVVTLRYGKSEFAGDWLSLFGTALTGRSRRGAELEQHFRQVHAEIENITLRIPEQKRPKVLYLYRANGNAFQVAGNNTSMNSDIVLAGGSNVAGRLPGFVQIGTEQLLAWAPDLILLNNFEKGVAPKQLYESRMLASIPAIRDKRVYLYPQGGFRWDPPSQESPLAWRWLLSIIHPMSATKTNLRDEITRSYKTLYGYTPSDRDIDHILRIDENGESRYYREKFSKNVR